MQYEKNDLVKSPLNYTGGKYKLLPQILPLFPSKITTFVDLFCGGCNVGINVKAEEIICIDNQEQLIRLFNTLKSYDKEDVFKTIGEIIEKYKLSQSSMYGYGYYNCTSSEGLLIYNKPHFMKLREDYNKRNENNFYYDMVFYTLTIFSFNNQIRFNKNGFCNIPAGKRDFNKKIKENLSRFIDKIKGNNINFISSDFKEIANKDNMNEVFVYADPPYLITTASYNEQGGWNEEKEKELLQLLDELNRRKSKFALSNVIESKGTENIILKEWSKKYKVNFLDYNYNNSNYQKKETNKKSKNVEVLITNY